MPVRVDGGCGGKKQEREAKVKAMERECGIRGAAKRNCDRDLFWAEFALGSARMGVGLGTHPGLGQTPHGRDIRVKASGGGDRTIGSTGKRRSLWPRGSVAQFLPKETEKAEDRNHDMAMEVQKVLDFLRHEESYAAETQALQATQARQAQQPGGGQPSLRSSRDLPPQESQHSQPSQLSRHAREELWAQLEAENKKKRKREALMELRGAQHRCKGAGLPTHMPVCASDAGPPSARSTLSSHKKSAKGRVGGAS